MIGLLLLAAAQVAPAPPSPPATSSPVSPRTPPAPSAAPDAAQGALPADQPPSTASADRPRSQKPREVHLLGDWAGVRTALSERGFTPTAAYLNQALVNVTGGSRETFRQAGQLTLGVEFDLRRIAGLPGSFVAAVYKRHGTSFNADSGLNALVTPQSIQGRGEIWRVGEFSYRLKTGAFDLRVGRIQLNENFDQARCDFVSGYGCVGTNARAAPASWLNTPVSQWGGRLAYAATPRVTVRVGVVQYNPRNGEETRPLYFGWAGGTGLLAPAEISYAPLLAGRLPGTYTVGVFYTDGNVDDPVLNRQGQLRLLYGGTPATHGAQWGGYLAARQQIVAPDADGSHALSAFLNWTVFSMKTTRNRTVAVAGVNYAGVLPGRPADEIGLAFGTARVNDRVTDAIRAANRIDGGGRPVPVREYSVELYYGITIAPGLLVAPGVQYVVDPAGVAARRNALVPELKTSIVL